MDLMMLNDKVNAVFRSFTSNILWARHNMASGCGRLLSRFFCFFSGGSVLLG